MSILLVSMLQLLNPGLPPKEEGIPQASKPSLVVVGDSYTLRTGVCTFPTYDECIVGSGGNGEGGFPYEVSYGSYLETMTGDQVELMANRGRGGDTCGMHGSYGEGVHDNQPRGLVQEVNGQVDVSRVIEGDPDILSILIGINDINSYGDSYSKLQSCLVKLYAGVASSERTTVALTYPGVSNMMMEGIQGPWNMKAAAWSVPPLNNAIRAAVQIHNTDHPDRPVLLFDTASAWTTEDAWTFTSDGAHPNEIGAQALAMRWARYFCLGVSPHCSLLKHH